MKNQGLVVEIFSATKESSGLPRPISKELNLIEDYGIQNDKFAGKKLEQTVMIVGLKSYEIAKNYGVELIYGSLGENILFDFDPHDFEVGQIFKIEDALIEITQICTVCSHLSAFDESLPKILKGHRGVYCKILNSGKVRKNMKIKDL